MAIGPSMQPYISDCGVLPSKQAVWCKFDHPRWGKLEVINTYAPMGLERTAERKKLWKEIFQKLDNHIAWIFVGDFNMIEEMED